MNITIINVYILIIITKVEYDHSIQACSPDHSGRAKANLYVRSQNCMCPAYIFNIKHACSNCSLFLARPTIFNTTSQQLICECLGFRCSRTQKV